ncbi:U2 small nuclear RNA auxiliary factor 2 [Lobosporangium transversale]|nr:U2 small nuclear RNA auxiliary factor 2 [Lobosporangium transversale]
MGFVNTNLNPMMDHNYVEHSHHIKSEPLSGRASELANSFLSELTEELANPMGAGVKREYDGHEGSDRRSSRHRGEDSKDKEKERDRDRHRSSSSRHERSDRDRERSDRDRHRSERDKSERSRDDRERSERDRRSERERGDRSDRDRDRDRERGERDRRDRDREYERYERDRRDRDRSRDRRPGRERDDRYRDSRYSSGRRSSRSRSPPREMSPLLDEHNILPINKRVRKLKNWDVPPPGYEDKTVQQVKDLGIFPPPGQPAVLRSEILQGMDPERAAQLVHELPPRPLRMNFPMGPQGAMGVNPFGNMGFGFRNNNNAPMGANGVDHTLARQQRRLYCGNLPMGINEESLANFFNQTMMSMNLTTGGGAPVLSVHINYEKNYAFVEFRTPEEATAAMAFDGIVFQAQSLKIRRPKDYQPPEGTNQEVPQIHVPGVISTNVPDSENKIFIGGLPLYLNDEQVIELLTAFGELKAFNLVKENNVGASKGFAFCEYLDPNITDIACQGLNNMMLGEKKLVVQRASVGSSRNQNPAGGANAIALHPNLMLPGVGPTEVVPTNVLQLLNMVTPEDLEEDQDYEEIVEDVRDECGKFGQVIDIKIPRPVDGQPVSGVGKIFVKYNTVDEAAIASRALSGRKFAERTVLTSFFDVDKFASNEF